MNDEPKTDLPYRDAVHAMQAGVAMEMERAPLDVTPKHLRVGVNSAMSDQAALARLLVKKGIFTAEEYAEEIRLEMCREVDRYEERLEREFGTKVTLR